VSFLTFSQTPELQKINELLFGGNIDKAKIKFEALSNTSSNDENYLFWVIKGSLALDEIANNSGSAFSPNDLKSIYKDFDRAIKLDNSAVSKISDFVEYATVNLSAGASAHFKNKDFGQVLSVYESTIDLLKYSSYPDSLFHYNIAIAYSAAGDSDKAMDKFRYCAENSCYGAKSYAVLIDDLRKKGEDTKMNAMIDQAHARYPNNSGLLIEIINRSILTGDTEGAINYSLTALKSDPLNEKILYTLGATYMELGDFDSANKYLLKATTVDNDYFDAWYNLGAMHMNQGVELNNQANLIPISNSEEYKRLKDKAMDHFRNCLVPLEQAYRLDPNNEALSRTLFKINMQLESYDNSKKPILTKKERKKLEKENKKTKN
jgi:tetratricopeptide (TPR) repeat protein